MCGMCTAFDTNRSLKQREFLGYLCRQSRLHARKRDLEYRCGLFGYARSNEPPCRSDAVTAAQHDVPGIILFLEQSPASAFARDPSCNGKAARYGDRTNLNGIIRALPRRLDHMGDGMSFLVVASPGGRTMEGAAKRHPNKNCKSGQDGRSSAAAIVHVTTSSVRRRTPRGPCPARTGSSCPGLRRS